MSKITVKKRKGYQGIKKFNPEKDIKIDQLVCFHTDHSKGIFVRRIKNKIEYCNVNLKKVKWIEIKYE